MQSIPASICIVHGTLGNKIRMDPMITGIPLPGTSIPCKISQYADDTNLFISDTESARKILILVELYELVSGAKLNKSKTFGMWLGRWRGRCDQPCNLTWSSECRKFYGVYLGTDEGVHKNWQLIVDKADDGDTGRNTSLGPRSQDGGSGVRW